MNLEGKTVLITGAAGALGSEVSRVAKDYGAKVILLDLSFSDKVEESEHTISLDLTDQGAVREALNDLSPIDAVLNVAGGFSMGPTLYEISEDEWDQMFLINVETARNVIAAVVPKMLEQGRGAIVNIGAAGAIAGSANMSAYSASKSTVMNMTQSLSEELKERAINVNAVLPGVIDTPANRNAMPDADYSKWVQPEQLANVMCFLICEEASGVHGALVPVKALT